MVSKVVSLEEILHKTKPEFHESHPKQTLKSKATKTKRTEEMKGNPKSGRFWKNPKTRFSSIVKTKGIKQPHAKKEALRAELKRVKDASRAILATREEEKQLRKEKRRENLKRQEENRKRSEIVQVIKNTSKIKRMNKKQLRYIEKRDTNKTQ